MVVWIDIDNFKFTRWVFQVEFLNIELYRIQIKRVILYISWYIWIWEKHITFCHKYIYLLIFQSKSVSTSPPPLPAPLDRKIPLFKKFYSHHHHNYCYLFATTNVALPSGHCRKDEFHYLKFFTCCTITVVAIGTLPLPPYHRLTVKY